MTYAPAAVLVFADAKSALPPPLPPRHLKPHAEPDTKADVKSAVAVASAHSKTEVADVKSQPATTATAIGLHLDELKAATFTLTSIPKSADRFDEIDILLQAAVGHNDDYVSNRVKAGKKPISFRLIAADEIANPVLTARFERERNRLKALNRTTDELKLKTAFFTARAGVVSKKSRKPDCCASAIRSTHRNPLTRMPAQRHCPEMPDFVIPCCSGWFGSPKHGVYLSRNCDYALKYSHDLAPLEPTDTVKVLRFKLIAGKSLHVTAKASGMLPTPEYDSHSSANYLEWFLFDESMCVPTHILTVQAYEDHRTDADDKAFRGE